MSKSTKPWHYKEVLEGMYLQEGLTIREIAEILNTSGSNIAYWFKKFDIQTREFDIGNFKRGTELSSEHRQLLSERAKERFANKENHPMYGRKHSSESRRKMSMAKLKKTSNDE